MTRFFGKRCALLLLIGWLAGGSACGPAALPLTPENRSIYSDAATIVPQDFAALPTMRIGHPSGPEATPTPNPAQPANPTASATAPQGLSEPNAPIAVTDLALPFDPDEIAAILRANPSLQFRYKHRAFVFPNCSTVTHLGEVMELYAHFNEGSPSAPPPPAFNVYAPADMRVLQLWGTQRYRLVLNSRIGLTGANKPAYLSLLSLTRLDESLAADLAGLLGVDAQALALDYTDPQSALGPFLFSAEYALDADDIRAPAAAAQTADGSLVIPKGARVGVKEGPWEWYPTCESEHTLSVHVFPTTNDSADHTQAVETRVPDITRHYLNLVVRALVIERGLTIDVQYRARNIGYSHDKLAAELFEPGVLEQVTLIPWLIDRHPHRFTVAPFGEPAITFDDELE